MKIVATTASRLEMKHFPINNWCSGSLLIIGSLSFLIYLIFFMAFAASLKCQRIAKLGINCELSHYYLVEKPQNQKIFDVQEAKIKTIVSSKGSRSYQVIISTPFGNYDLLSASSNYDENERIATQINDFLYSTESYLSVRQNRWHNYFFYIIIISGFAITGVFLCASPVVNCTFYKSLNKVVIEYKGLGGVTIEEYPLENILRIDSQERETRSGKSYRLVLVFRSPKVGGITSPDSIPIHNDYTNAHSTNNIVYSVNSFLWS
ncbi:hypothetical protein [Nostoc sp. MS1]|uniref:hypothetical protein n=1 Tax=Nostoc sp. MS1 TaxID=2764711 RepID=UPI001CC4936B|nr:hypothetical protein [Nostoc sp. MS1]BCL37954.1 hypothetical protein NSMS1_44010 [Nostoc sp. MS1]